MTDLETPEKSEAFASRWSRRKHAVEAGEQPDLIEDEEKKQKEIALEQARIVEHEKADKLAALNALTDDDMPDVDSLHEDSDFSQFMSASVSEELRKIALRKLFHGEQYNVRDGLDEYDGDYTYFEKLDPATITADMKHLLEVEAEKLKRLQEETIDEGEETDEEVEALDSPDLESGGHEPELVSEATNEDAEVLAEDDRNTTTEQKNLTTSDIES